MDKPPHLTLVSPPPGYDHDHEFLPLPFYPWDERPPALPLDIDECATAIWLALNLDGAARLLKVPLIRLVRLVRVTPRLERVLAEANETLVAQAASEYAMALVSADDRRREWAASKIMNSRVASSHPLAPAPPSTTLSASLTTTASTSTSRKITFRWRTSDDTPDTDTDTPTDTTPDDAV